MNYVKNVPGTQIPNAKGRYLQRWNPFRFFALDEELSEEKYHSKVCFPFILRKEVAL